ncbi:MAG: hypothetical protein ABF294_05645 [Flavobacteriales bacterium]
MSQVKKFGTFLGVFTPSILTILGVIMYMRLSWVVGNAGLEMAIGIILIAHIVSVATGLSVSSVATDRKIKAGGIYYMLSRSLGLPIGGSIGITLFVATALSIALYLIGFAESALVVLQEPLGIEEVTINHIRVAGSLALFFIVAIAYISTSIAIKAQLWILGAIILSVISILFGTDVGKEFDMTGVTEGGVNFFVLFGIFFPAVTGFTAGVAMSGDLKDPKKSIPWGTMLAVGVGLIVYVGLAIFIYYSFEGNLEAIMSDKNALIKFGWIPVLVIAGIWGATLSSALGGILGAPRILQAMSVDSITPKIFAKGKGEENEPRNALILTFVIAQAGVLIGELDVIAEVVAMFYLSAYLFINVSCFLEQWASPDFRPSFKIPIWISLAGAIVTFVLMIQLNLLAAVVAILVMMLIFIWLTRKQLVLGSGDVWQSVWSSIVKLGLKNLDKKSTHKRNWNPNILLFSGGTETRKHLIDFSKTVAGAKGMISNFDLIENKTSKLLLAKHKQSVKDDELYSQGIFARKQECKDVYLGIEAISSTYGFSGVEPNTVLTSWEQSSDDPTRFAQLTNKLCELDYNVLYLDYDKQRGFGAKKSIDIWWNDFSNTAELSLNLAKFMSSSIDWRQAQIRVLYVNNQNDKKGQLEEIIDELLSNYRIPARSKIINNEIEQKELYEIMKVESYDSDLVIVGVPNHLDDEEKFVEKTDELVKILGTTLLIRPSSNFEETEVDLGEKVEIATPDIQENIEEELSIESDFYAYPWLNNLMVFNKRNANHFLETVFSEVYKKYLTVIDKLQIRLKENEENFIKQFSSNSSANIDLLDKTFKEYVQELSSEIKAYNTEFLPEIEKSFSGAISSLLAQNENYQSKLPKKIKREIDLSELEPNEKDSGNEKRAKKWISFQKKTLGIKPKRNIYYRDFVTYFYHNFYLKILMRSFMKSGIFVYKNTTELNQIADTIKASYHEMRGKKNLSKDEFSEFTNEIIKSISESKNSLEANYKELAANFFKLNTDYTFSLYNKLNLLSINGEVANGIEEKGKSEFKKQLKEANSFPKYFKRNNELVNNALVLDVSLHEIHPEIHSVINDTVSSINRLSINPQISLIKQFEKLDKSLVENDTQSKLEIIKYLNKLPLFSFDIEELINITIKKVEKIVYKLSGSLDIMDVESINNLNEVQGIGVKKNTIQVQRLILFSVENKLIKSLNQESDKLQSDLNELVRTFKNKSITLETIDFETEKEVVVTVREDLVKSSGELKDGINTRFKNFISKVSEELEETRKILDYDFIAGNSAVIDQYIKKTGVTTSRISRLIQSTKRTVKKRLAQTLSFVDRQRDEFLVAEFKLKHGSSANLSSVVSNFVEKVKMPKAVYEQVPFFYNKLFIGEHASPLTIEHRDTEIEQAQKAIQLLNRKSGGAILILGEQLSGKKYFSDYLTSRMLKREVISVYPAIDNIKVKASFERAVNFAFGNELSLEDNLIESSGKTLLFNNIEKWGADISVIECLKEMIEKYGKKHHFILSSSIAYYNYLKPILSLDEVVISSILLLPLKKDGFIETFKLKHKAGGLKFTLNNKQEKDFTDRQLDSFFNKYHSIYKGNIGRSFLAWVNNIQLIEGTEMEIKEPKTVYFPAIENSDWIVVLRVLSVFREISKKELEAIFGQDLNYVSYLNQMKRIRLINEPKNGVYELNSEVYFAVKQYLRDKKIIA